MGKIEIFEVKKLRSTKWVGPHYYDYPDGEDLPGKLLYTTCVSGGLGLIAGAINANIGKIPSSVKGKLLRTAQCFIPCVGVALTFTFVTYFSTRIRGKDDEYNYVIGGFFSGLALARLIPFKSEVVIATLAFPAIGYYKKHCQLNGETMFKHQTSKNLPSYYLRNWDTTKIAERPGNWTRDPLPK